MWEIPKVRKLATAAAVSLVLSSGAARALGLGDIEMRSALNQPMNAEIPLTSVQPGEASGMIVKLASPDAFSRAGIERSGSLTDLRFSVDESAGTPVIKISSSRPVVEPFLNFLVEVDWPTGRMVREYTVLLDPPVFMGPSASDRNTASDQPATSQRSDASLSTPTPIDRAGSNDGFDVEVVGSDVEIADDAAFASEGDVNAGEVVSLDSLDAEGTSDGVGEVELIDDSTESVITNQSDVVVLSDPGVENADAAAQFQADQNFEFEVEIVGDNNEVSDTFVADSAVTGVQDASESEIVSLDSLETNGSDAGQVTVQRGDTLSNIADSIAVPGVSSQQLMMALLNANQNAFINGNVNLVKAGAILRIPEGDELTQLTQAQAVAQIGEQNQLWREYRDSVRSTAVTQVATAPSVASEPEPQPPVEPVEEEPTQLSEEAQRILDEAKKEAAKGEARNPKELNILGIEDPTSTVASATDDNNDANEAAQLGEINQKLALAKEELASTQLESTDLLEQSNELQSTAENMESLVKIRQDEVARLEEALKTASAQAEAEKLAAAEAEEAAALAEEEKAAQAEAEKLAQAEAEQAAQAEAEKAAQAEAEQAAQAEAEKAAQAEAEQAAQAEAEKAAQAEAEQAAQAEAEKAAQAEAEQAAADSDATGEDSTENDGLVVDEEPENALTAAGENLDSVELVDDTAVPTDNANLGAEAQISSEESTPWYIGLLQKYGKWVVVGIGGLCALLLGALLLGKRRQKSDDRLEFDDEVEFLDDEIDGVQSHAGVNVGDGVAASDVETAIVAKKTGAGAASTADVRDDVGAAVGGAATAAAAAGGGAAIALGSQSGGSEAVPVGANMDGLDNTSGPDGLDPDDTISEVDVYLAYGLHGQAEELLSKAIDRDPTNHEYALKLLQTQHAQGNAEAFAHGATSYHNSYGGNNAPNWDTICNLGLDLQPNNALFAGSAVEVESIGKSVQSAENLEVDDFTTDENGSVGSVSRDFGDASEAANDIDETELMDESLDPAFAFDETDLEATGDFSQMSSDIAAEEASSIEKQQADDTALEFPDFNATDSIGDVADVGKDKLSSVGSSLKSGVGGGAAAAAGDLAATAASAKDSTSDVLEDALSLDDIDSAAIAANDDAPASVAEDLTLDLDELSGDLELEEAEDLLDQTSAGGLEDLEIADLNNENELFSDNVASIDGSDEMDTMMDLAKAYIDMGDKDSASSALDEIVKGGNPEQVSEAETLLRKIS